MGRLSAIFIAFCMVLIAGSVGVVTFLSLGFTGMEASVVAIAVLTALVMVNSVTGRQRDRSDIGSQIADLSRGTADIGRQVSELDRRIVALEGDVASAMDRSRATTEPLTAEIDELGQLVKELADAVAAHEQMLEIAIHNATPARAGARVRRPGARARAGRARRRCRPRRARRARAPRRARPLSGPFQGHGAERDRRADRARGRSQSRRPVPPADRHAAAAQGALLRGADAAARRRRHAVRAGGFPRATPKTAG